MERKYISFEDIIASAQGSLNDFLIKERFLIFKVREKIASNVTPYYSIDLKYKKGSLNAKRFTSGESEFDSLKQIYLVGNIIEIAGIYQYKWNSIKIFNEKLIKSVKEEKAQKNGENFNYKKKVSLKDKNEKIDELLELTRFGTTIQIKSYINDYIKSVFDHASRRKIREFKKTIKQHIENWPKDRRDELCNEYSRIIEHYENLQPSWWKKWGSGLIKLISVLR